MIEPEPEESWRNAGLLEGARRLLVSFADVLRTRLDILSIELQEEGARIGRLAALAAVALFFFVLGVAMATLFVTALFWDTHRLQVLGGFAVLYLLAAVILVLILRHRLRTGPRPFAETLAELRKDQERLGSGP